MTVIATDGHTLASDSQYCAGDLICSGKKIFKVGDSFYGFSGYQEDGLLFIQWLKDGGKKPELDDDFAALSLTPKGIFLYAPKLVVLPISESMYAIGSGRSFALGAMYAGKSPSEAIKITCNLVDGCGLPVKSFSLG